MKPEKEYEKLYGNIPKEYDTRIFGLIDDSRINKRTKITDMIKESLDIRWNIVNFVIYLVPHATPRPRYNFFTHNFYVKEAANNKKRFKKFIDKLDLDMITTPCKFYCSSYFPIPKSMSVGEKILAELGFVRPISKPDWDNIGKSYSDMIQGSLLYDDSLIIEGISKKYYSTKPRVEVQIKYMEGYDCKYNAKKMSKKL